MFLVVPAPQEQLFRIPAMRYEQGLRTVFTFALDLAQLDSLLPQRVDEEMVKDANRRLTLSHAKRIEQYLDQQEDWVLGGILLGIEPEAVNFIPFRDEGGEPSPSFGMLQIPLNRLSALRMFDGQHRRRAIQDLLARLRDSEKEYEQHINVPVIDEKHHTLIAQFNDKLLGIRAKRESLEKQAVPIVLYEEGDINALRRMFADAAKTKPIEAVTTARFDDRDPFNRAAYEVAEQSEFLRDRIDMEHSMTPRMSPNILAFNQLATILKTLMYGYSGRVSRERKLEIAADYQPVVRLGIEWADDFLPSISQEYEQLLSHEIDIPTSRPTTFAFNATVLRVLAACFHGWREEVGNDAQSLIEYIRNESFSIDLDTSFLIKAGLVVAGSKTPVARKQEVQKAIRHILHSAKAYMSRASSS